MRKFKGTLISILVLLILAGICFLIVNINTDDNNEKVTEDESSSFRDVLTVKFEDITSYNVKNSYGEYTFELKDGIWSCSEEPDIELNQDAVFSVIVSSSYYSAYDVAEGDYAPADYGLDTPSMTVKIGLNNGDTHSVIFGSVAPTDDHLYYITVDDKQAVYAVLGSKYDTLNVPLGAFRDTEFFTLNYNGIKKITIGGKDRETIVIEENASQNEMSLSNWLMTSPYHKSVNEFTLSDLIIAPLSEQSIKIVSYVEDKPASLSKYGLNNPENYISFAYADYVITLKFGSYDEFGNVYAIRSDRDSVVTVSAAPLAFFEYTAFEYVDKSIYFAVITDLSSLNVKSGDKKYEITIPSKGNDYRINDKKTTEEKVKSFYADLASLTISGVVTQPVTDSADIIITYNYVNGNVGKVEFIPYTARNYAVKIDGNKPDFYIKKSDVSALMSRIAEL